MLKFRHFFLELYKTVRYINSLTPSIFTVHLAPDFLGYLLFLLEYQ